VVIQSQVRGWLARRLVRMTRSAARAEQAAKLLQRQVRGRMARKVVGAVRQACLEEKHVVVVQRAWRVHWARRCVEEMRRLRVEMRAAGLIEAAYVRYASRLKSDKGFAMRRQKSRCLERQERASRCIQVHACVRACVRRARVCVHSRIMIVLRTSFVGCACVGARRHTHA